MMSIVKLMLFVSPFGKLRIEKPRGRPAVPCDVPDVKWKNATRYVVKKLSTPIIIVFFILITFTVAHEFSDYKRGKCG